LPKIDKKDNTGIMNWESKFEPLLKYHDLKTFDYNGEQSRLKILRNLVDYEVGKLILQSAYNVISSSKSKQTSLF